MCREVRPLADWNGLKLPGGHVFVEEPHDFVSVRVLAFGAPIE